MMRALATSMLWLLGGSAAAGALFWWLLNTSEATVFTLAQSAVLVLATFTAAAWSLTRAVRVWQEVDGTPHRGGGTWWGIWLVLLVTGHLLWLGMHQGLDWVSDHEGELSAWAIAQFGVSDITALLAGVQTAGAWLSTVGVAFAMLCCGAAALSADRPEGWQRQALRHARQPLRLLVMSAVVIVTSVAPQHYLLYAMPQGLPATWVQPVLAAVKLALLAVLTGVGGALVLRLAVIPQSRVRDDADGAL